MQIRTIPLWALMAIMLLSSYTIDKGTGGNKTFSLTVKVNSLRNSKGSVLFALYNNKESFRDEKFRKSYRLTKGSISIDSSMVIFDNLPAGKYVISILHDEDSNSKITKGIFLPKEGIGFSNYQSIGLANRPTFKNASFDLQSNLTINIKIIYL